MIFILPGLWCRTKLGIKHKPSSTHPDSLAHWISEYQMDSSLYPMLWLLVYPCPNSSYPVGKCGLHLFWVHSPLWTFRLCSVLFQCFLSLSSEIVAIGQLYLIIILFFDSGPVCFHCCVCYLPLCVGPWQGLRPWSSSASFYRLLRVLITCADSWLVFGPFSSLRELEPLG